MFTPHIHVSKAALVCRAWKTVLIIQKPCHIQYATVQGCFRLHNAFLFSWEVRDE